MKRKLLVFLVGALGAACGVLAVQHLQVLAAADGDPATDNLPKVVPYEGTIIRDGAPLTGSANVHFIVEGPGGTTLYSQRHSPSSARPPVQLDSRGRFSVLLGPDGSLTDAIEDGEPLFVRLEVSNGSGGWTPLAGRQAIGSSAYALWSGSGTDAVVGDSVRVGAAAIASPADAGLFVDVDGTPEARFYDFFIDSEADAGNAVANLVSGAAVQANGSYAYTNAERDATRLRFNDTANERLAILVDDISGGAPAENATVVWQEPALVIDHQGRVGIGKQPAATLDVDGQVRIDGNLTLSNGDLEVAGTLTSGVSLPAGASVEIDGQRPIRFGKIVVADDATESLGISAADWTCGFGGVDMMPAQVEHDGQTIRFSVSGSNEWQVFFDHVGEAGGGGSVAYVCLAKSLF